MNIVNGLERMKSANIVRKVVKVDSVAIKIGEYLSEVEQSLDTYRVCLQLVSALHRSHECLKFFLEQETFVTVHEIRTTMHKNCEEQKVCASIRMLYLHHLITA